MATIAARELASAIAIIFAAATAAMAIIVAARAAINKQKRTGLK
jgi:hypothetical protein